MKNKITADEARKIAGPTIEEEIDDVYVRIKSVAEQGERSIHLHDWANDGYGNTEKYKALKKELEESGFEVEFFYEERQFVDMYVIVKW